MARRKKHVHQSSERWLVSYADLLTLLFAFFVVMFASSQTDKARVRQISRAVDKAFQGSSIAPGVAAMLGGADVEKGQPGDAKLKVPVVRHAEKAFTEAPPQLDMSTALKALDTTLGAEMKQGQVTIHLEERGAVISLSAQSVFPSGGDTIDKSIYPLLTKLAVTLNRLPNLVRLEGHTDALPISNSRFRSNWELSAARSIAMMKIMTDRYGISPERMAIVGYADTNAIADNATEDGRMKNRRVDMVILSDYGTHFEPGKYLPPTRNLAPVSPSPAQTGAGH
jgi:chemotaxis protein MotB